MDKEDFEIYNAPEAFKDNKAKIEELRQIENRTQDEDDELSDAITHVYDTYLKAVEERRIDAKKQGQTWKDVKSYISNMLQNEEAADRVMGVIKGVAVFKYLGFRVSSMAVNATNMVTAIPAAMSATANIPMHKAPRLLAIAANKYSRYKLGKSYQAMEGLNPTVTEDEKWALDEIIKKKWDGAKFNREALAALENKWGRRWSNIVEFSMIGPGLG